MKPHHTHTLRPIMRWLGQFHKRHDGVLAMLSPEQAELRNRKANEAAWRLYRESGGQFGWPESEYHSIYSAAKDKRRSA